MRLLAGGIDQRGSWSDDILAFVISGKISDRNEVWAQLETTGTQPTAFTWAFMDHRFSDNLSAHKPRTRAIARRI